MITELRTYTINRGAMDEFVGTFNDTLMPLYKRLGIYVIGAWVNRAQNEFVWMRVYDDEADREAKNKAFQTSPEQVAMGAGLQANIAKIEVKDLPETVHSRLP